MQFCKLTDSWHILLKYAAITIISTILLITFCVGIKFSYNTKYLVDEYYDLYDLREPSIDRQFTIRVTHPGDINTLKRFVEHYALCQEVYEIVIMYDDKYPDIFPINIPFTYEHTHSKVTFFSEVETSSWISTEALMLLDVDVFVSCPDLKFTHNVWSASYNSLVGYFPRLHTAYRAKQGDHTMSYTFYNSFYVLWHNRYSLMLSSGAMVRATYWQEYHGESTEARRLRYIADENPLCSSMALSLWLTYSNEGTPPVWVDVPYTIDSQSTKAMITQQSDVSRNIANTKVPDSASHDIVTSTPHTSVDIDTQRTICLNAMMEVLHYPKLDYTTHKAAIARNVLFWS